MATNEYIGAKRRAYAQANRAKRKRILDEVCETTGYERKYANRLLTGSRKFHERKGRGRTYGDDVAEVLKKVWMEAGCPCLPYFKAEVERWVEEYATQVAHIEPDVRAKLLAMSERTMSRLLSGVVRVKPGWTKCNKRSGRGARNEIKANTPCASGERIMACNVPPGDVQIDTFALGGGDPSDNFFWILDGADRKTQWTVLCPTWNRGQHATLEALRHIEGKFPFDILAIHSDNGGEVMNSHVAAYLGRKAKKPFLWRSRPRHSNDNAHVEEKNRSSGRQLFGEARLDCPSLQDELVKLCDDWSDFRNFFCPCKMLVSKEKRPDGKGCRCRYDKPRTPYQRVLDEHVLTPEQEAALRACRERLSGMDLYRRVLKRMRKIRRIQAAYAKAKREGGDLSPFAARRQQPAHEPCRRTKLECPVFGKPKTTKLSTECLFYLTNWVILARDWNAAIEANSASLAIRSFAKAHGLAPQTWQRELNRGAKGKIVRHLKKSNRRAYPRYEAFHAQESVDKGNANKDAPMRVTNLFAQRFAQLVTGEKRSPNDALEIIKAENPGKPHPCLRTLYYHIDRGDIGVLYDRCGTEMSMFLATKLLSLSCG